jgi:predicted HicB family RNase H-like nuclease
MTQKELQPQRIPEFSSREEAAAWFDSHDIGDYLDEFTQVDVQIEPNLTKSLNVRLAPEVFTELQLKADEKGVGTSTLVRMWILEQLSSDRARSTD